MKKINFILNCIIGAFLGGFLGNSAFVLWNHQLHPEQHAFYSAPWYTGILVYGCVAAAVVLVCILAKIVLKLLFKRTDKKRTE